MLHSKLMLRSESWAAGLAVAPWLLSCLPAEDLASYSRGWSSGSPDVLGMDSGLQPSSRPPAAPEANASASEGSPDASSPGDEGPDGSIASIEDAGLSASGNDASGSLEAPACEPSEVSGPNGDCFVALAALLSWADARLNCQARGVGWDLASLRSSEDSAFWAPRLTFEAWVAASDAADEGTWLWVSDNTPFWSGDGLTGSAVNGAYTNWNTDEPNGSDNSDCARLLPRTEALPDRNVPWADLECAELRGAICEGPAE